MKDLKDWARELERAVTAAEREVRAQNEAFKESLAEWGTDEESAAFAAAMAFSPGNEKKRAMLASGAMRG
ncbi:MAG: hypothetical protein U0269_19235 [Polyangiales bacterium]